MHIQVEWDNEEKTIIRYTFRPGWDWNELITAFQQVDALMDIVDHKVDTILDFTLTSLMFPKDALSFSRRALENPRHPNINNTVVVGNRFVKSLADVVFSIAPKSAKRWNLQVAQTMEEAYELLENQR